MKNIMGKQQTEAVMENILTRTTIRRFTDEPVNEQQVEMLLRAGMAAPSACNKQPWRFVVVQDKATQERLAAEIGPASPAKHAHTLIVVCGDMAQTLEGEGLDYWVEDCSAATQNILLAAHAMELGAVWLGVYPIRQRCEIVQKVLSIPEDIVPLGMIAVGHPAEAPAPKNKWKPEYVHYSSWSGASVLQ